MGCHTFFDERYTIEDVCRTATENRLLSMEIEFSQLCNFRCPYCYLEARPDVAELSDDESRGIILQAKALGARTIIILGGEPMIYPSIMEMIKFIRDNGMNVEIFTNGSNITDENARALADFDVKVVLKLNSRDPEKQDRMCGCGDAHQVIHDALKNLKDAGYGNSGKPMAISSVICADNIDELPELWRWARTEGIDPYFEMITPQGSAIENDWVHVGSDRVEQLFNEIAEIDRTSFNNDWKPQPPLVGDNCLRHQFSCYVNCYAEVMPCVGIDLVVGNLRNKSLEDVIRDSEVIQDLRGFREHIKGPCATCKEAELCYGCRGAAYQLTGDYLASDPLCWHNTERRDEIEHLPLPVDSYIPHRGRVKVVDRLLEVGERLAVVESVIGENCAFLSTDGALEPEAFIEVMAQSSAAHNGFRTRKLAEKVEGFLLGAKKLEILGSASVGDRLLTTVFKEARFGDFGIIRGTVERDGECLARGEIKVYHKKSGEV